MNIGNCLLPVAYGLLLLGSEGSTARGSLGSQLSAQQTGSVDTGGPAPSQQLPAGMMMCDGKGMPQRQQSGGMPPQMAKGGPMPSNSAGGPSGPSGGPPSGKAEQVRDVFKNEIFYIDLD